MILSMEGDHHQAYGSSNYLKSEKVEDENSGFDTSILASMRNLSFSEHSGESATATPQRNNSNLDYNEFNYQPIYNLEQPTWINNNMGINYNSQALPSLDNLHNYHIHDIGNYSPNLFTPSTTHNTNNFNFLSPNPRISALHPSSGFHESRATIQNPGVLPFESIITSSNGINPDGDILQWARTRKNLSLVKGLITLSPHLDLTRDIFNALVKNFYDMINSESGCQFFLKYIEVLEPYQIDKIVLAMIRDQPSLLSSTCNPYATRVIQKLIKVGKKLPSIKQFPPIFALHIEDLMKNKIGRHVLQECFVRLNEHKNLPIYREVRKHWWSIANDEQGCIALNECLRSMDDISRDCLLKCISQQAATLSQDPYGNFVLQHVLSMKYAAEYTEEIVMGLRQVYERLCTIQSGSHVVEKCLETYYMPCVVDEILKSHNLIIIAKHQYGNYVIQKALRETKEKDVCLYQKLCKALSGEISHLECSPYGRNVANLLRRGSHGWMSKYRSASSFNGDKPRGNS